MKEIKFGRLELDYLRTEQESANVFSLNFIKKLENSEFLPELLKSLKLFMDCRGESDLTNLLKDFFFSTCLFSYVMFSIGFWMRDHDISKNIEWYKKFDDFDMSWMTIFWRRNRYILKQRNKEFDFIDLSNEYTEIALSKPLEINEVASEFCVNYMTKERFWDLAKIFSLAFTGTIDNNELSPVKAFVWLIAEKAADLYLLLWGGLIDAGFDEIVAEEAVGELRESFRKIKQSIRRKNYERSGSWDI